MRLMTQYLLPVGMWVAGIGLVACEPVSYADPEDVNDTSDTSRTPDGEETRPELDLDQCAFGTGEYHNYFLDRGRSEAEVAERIDAAWTQLFEGDPNEEAIYYEAGSNDDGPLAYVMDIASDDVRSEGMSYGMMFAVQLDKQAEFDALWNWAKTYMWHGDSGHPFYEYFAWSMRTDGVANEDVPAPDGEEYFAMALYFAAGRWGNGAGIYNYREQADRLVSAMKNRSGISGDFIARGETTDGTGTALFHPRYTMVRFSPNTGYFTTEQGDHTDPSYHLPAFYQLWSLWGPEEDWTFWYDAAKASRDFFQAAAHPETGLTPDYAAFDGTPVEAWNNNDRFGADARRTVMNWSMDWAWFCLDERERDLSDKLQAFFIEQGVGYDALYELDGTPVAGNYYTPSLVAMNAVSALSATDDNLSADFVNDLWSLEIPTGTYRYYDGVLYLFAMLHVSGNFRIYSPE